MFGRTTFEPGLCALPTQRERLLHARDVPGLNVDEEALGPGRLAALVELVDEDDAPEGARRDAALHEAPLLALDLGARLEARLGTGELDRLLGVDLALRGAACSRRDERDPEDGREEEELAERRVPQPASRGSGREALGTPVTLGRGSSAGRQRRPSGTGSRRSES